MRNRNLVPDTDKRAEFASADADFSDMIEKETTTNG